MVAEAEPRLKAWRHAADALASELRRGLSVVLLCEGDASLFASSSYVQLALRKQHPDLRVKLIPGIPAVCAAAAASAEMAIDWPLALQQDGVLIRPCPDQESDLERLLESAKADCMVLALIKLGQRWPWVRTCLDQRRLLEGSLFAQRVGWPDQVLARATEIPAESKPYFSLLLIRQTWPEVVP
jgi:precorrin-2/cobalt-factor-2 C20-methyltransferase